MAESSDASGPGDLVLSSGSLENPPLPELIDAALAADIPALSLWPGHYHPSYAASGSSLDEMAQRIADSGLVVQDLDAIVTWVGPADPGGPYFEEAVERDVFELADAVAARGVNVLQHAATGTSLDAAAESFASVCDRAASHGLRANLEFSRRRITPDLPTAAKVVGAAGRDNGGLTVDAWHVHFGPGRFDDLDAVPGHLIGAVQLNDAPKELPADLDWATRHRRAVPGAGVVDLRGLLASLARIGSEAPRTLEVFDAPRVAELGCAGFAQMLAESVRGIQRSAGNAH